MHKLVSHLIVYKNIGDSSILLKLSDIFKRFEEGNYKKEALTSEIYTEINRLLELATKYGFNKNLWHNYLAYLLAMTENPFTLISEKAGSKEGSVNEFVRSDFAVFKQLFDYDFSRIQNGLGIDCFDILSNYQAILKSEQIFNKSVSDKVQELSDSIEKTRDVDEMYRVVTSFYRDYGVGMLGLNKAFRIVSDSRTRTSANVLANATMNVFSSPSGRSTLLAPITTTGDMVLDDLIGYDMQKERLIENTEAFVEGRTANNVLLYGDAGTGKSSSIKCVLNEYYSRGLRMIEMYKHELKDLPKVIDEIKNRNYRFIIFMDDLSFEDFETEYKYLKAVIEGGLEMKPENLLIYATSNRRHLIRETWGDRSDMSQDELHHSDTMQEKLSLVDRFGITIGFYKPTLDEYFEIVVGLAKRHREIDLSEEMLKDEANRWAMRHGGISGRTAQQFINHLKGAPKSHGKFKS